MSSQVGRARRHPHHTQPSHISQATCGSREPKTRDSGKLNAPPVSEDAKASIILPAYNEEIALPVVLRSLLELPNFRHEIIVVDDGSTDSTSEVAQAFPCRVIRLHKNLGKGAAVRAGVAAATTEQIIIMDADNTYPVSAIAGVVQQLAASDFVYCVRSYGASEMPLVNRLGNAFFNRVVKLLVRLEGDDLLSGMYGITRRAFLDLDIQASGFDLEVEMRIKAERSRLQQSRLTIPYQTRLGVKKLRPVKDGWRILKMAAKWQYLIGGGISKRHGVPDQVRAGVPRGAR